jgi:hypothetical protein
VDTALRCSIQRSWCSTVGAARQFQQTRSVLDQLPVLVLLLLLLLLQVLLQHQHWR